MQILTFRRCTVVSLLILISLSGALVARAGPREDLERLVREVQAAPADVALRERVIAAALALKPAPVLPDAAERHLARGEAAVERAKSATDFALAVREFDAASRVAPWHAPAYFNLGVAQEKAGQPKDAIGSFKLYLLAAPGASDAAAVKKRLYKLEFDAEQATAAAASPKSAIADLVGTWVLRDGDAGHPLIRDYFFRAEADGADGLRLTFSHHAIIRNSLNQSTASPYRSAVLRLKIRGNEIGGNHDLRFTDDCLLPPESAGLRGYVANDRKRLDIDMTRAYRMIGMLANGCTYFQGTFSDRWSIKKSD